MLRKWLKSKATGLPELSKSTVKRVLSGSTDPATARAGLVVVLKLMPLVKSRVDEVSAALEIEADVESMLGEDGVIEAIDYLSSIIAFCNQQVKSLEEQDNQEEL